MTPEQERLAEALAVNRIHGERAPLFVAERIGALAVAGDKDGVERWRQIAGKLSDILFPSGHPQ